MHVWSVASVLSDFLRSQEVDRQAPLSLGFSRQEYWSGLPFPSPGDLPNPGIKAGSPALKARPFRYDLNEIPYDYTVKVRNRFKGLDLIHRVPDELWTEVRDIV